MSIRYRFLLVACLTAVTAVTASAQTEAWRVAAEQRIEQHRKGTFRIVVRDDSGAPVPNATVRVAMQEHDFGFGTAVSANMMSNTRVPEYRARLADLTGDGRTFNRAVFQNAMKWPYWEASSAKSLIVTHVLWLRSRGMQVRGHNLMWPSWSNMPRDMEANKSNATYLRDRVQSHIRSMAGYRGIKGSLVDWDVLNEPVHLTDLRDALRGQPGYPTGEEIYAQAFQWAAEADPDAHLFVNEYNIIAHYNSQRHVRDAYRNVIQGIIDAGAPLHGIGMQGHISPSDPTSAPDVYRALEEFAHFGKALAVTEYDLAYNQQAGACRKADEDFAAGYLRDFLTVVFSHPLAESFTMWGFWDGDHWRCDAALFREDWTLKPSGQAFIDLVFGAWWTDETVTTDANGEAVVRGFLGDYELSADLPGGTLTREVKLATNDTTDVVLSRSTTSAERPDREAGFEVSPNYPNPFAVLTTVDYVLAQPAEVVFEVFDALGRRVDGQDLGLRMPGRHAVTVEAANLPPGVYLYRLRAGDRQHAGRMLRLP